MNAVIRSLLIVLTLAFASSLVLADEHAAVESGFRILSWNISDNAFEEEPKEFLSVLRWADPDIVLLDEVSPSANLDDLHAALSALRPGDDDAWHISVGASGGRQRDIIASRAPLEALPEFSSIIRYPEEDRSYILEHMSGWQRENSDLSMDFGIPVNAAIILTGGKRLLTVIADLQCCGDDPESWQEYRRQIEAREIRRLITQVLERTVVHGLVIAGDFNLVNGIAPAVILNEPYRICPEGLKTAELYHPDGIAKWTWDGRGMPFPSGTLDFQYYCTQSLETRSGFVLDPENLAPKELEQLGLDSEAVKRTGRHRPLVAEYSWK